MAVLVERHLQKGSLPWSLYSDELKEFRDTPYHEITHMFHLWSTDKVGQMSANYIRFLTEVWYKSDTQTRLKVRQVFQQTFRELRGQPEAITCRACPFTYSGDNVQTEALAGLNREDRYLEVERFPRKLTRGELREMEKSGNKYQIQLDEENYEIHLPREDKLKPHNTSTNFPLKRQEAQEKIRRSAEESSKRKKIASLALLGIVSVGFTLYQASQCVPEDESLMGQILGSIGIISRNVESSAFCSAVNWLRA